MPLEAHDPRDGDKIVRQEDSARGGWCVSGLEMTVWVDARSLATGLSLQVNGGIVEDACLLHRDGDAQHINLGELDASFKVINLAFQWNAKVLHLVTDSASTYGWVNDTLTGKLRLKTTQRVRCSCWDDWGPFGAN